jgi:cysteine desulfurase
MTDETSIVYLDNAATTRPYPEVIDVISEALAKDFGNPSSLHRKGIEAKRILEHSRAIVAQALDVEPTDIFFTSGGTESNNLAITGASLARREPKGKIITSELEHPSVTKTVRNLKREGWRAAYIRAVGGNFDWEQLTDELDPSTSLVTVMSVQNELGYRFPLEKIAQLRTEYAPQALVHTDAVQSFGKLPLTPQTAGIDLASISSHKIGGPKGIGALYVHKRVKMFTTAFGGGQERGLRSGTEALPLIAGFGKAVEITMRNGRRNLRLVADLRRYLLERLRTGFRDLIINSREDGSPYIVNFALPSINSKKALELLSDQDIFVSTTAACESNHLTVPPGTWREKHPLALQLAGIPKRTANNVFRISFFSHNTRTDIDRFIDALQQIDKRSRP